jgi:glycolate oxidase iron-sulfur subunit
MVWMETKSAWPSRHDQPATADITRCVHCGLCLNQCPTYVELGLETESPRGRIFLMRMVDEGKLPLNETVVQHLDLCLQCRACEAACPSGVPFGRMMERTRSQVGRAAPSDKGKRRLTRFMLRQLLPHRSRLAALFAAGRVYQGSGLRTLNARFVLPLLPKRLQEFEAQLPRLTPPFERDYVQIANRLVSGPDIRRVIMLDGCVMPFMYGETNRATARVLARNGCQVLCPEGQTCCGALMAHAGDLEGARKLARRNIDVMLRDDVDAIVVNSAGCGSTMKEYHELLAEDRRYAEKAGSFSAKVKDFTEYLASLPVRPPLGRVEARVSWQDPCHLAHAQRITEAPRDLLRRIPGVELVETHGSDLCCGSAGIYSLLEPEMSARLRKRKAENIAAAAPDIVVTANPGCMLQYEAGLRAHGVKAEVLHIAYLLDRAYGNAK